MLGIILIVEQSHLSVRRTLVKIGIPPTTFYRPYDRIFDHGPEGLEDRPSCPSRASNLIRKAVRDRILTLALQKPELSPCELTVPLVCRRPNSHIISRCLHEKEITFVNL